MLGCLTTGTISRRRVVTAALLAVPLAGLGRLALTEGVQAADVAVNIMNFSFQPTLLTIAAGTTVVWTNQDTAAHTTTSDTGVWDSGVATPHKKGDTFQFTFKEVGTFPYHCNIHPNMHGTVVVTTASAPAAPAPAPVVPAAPVAPAAPAPAAPTAPAPAAPPAPSAAVPVAPPRTGGGQEARYIHRLGDG